QNPQGARAENADGFVRPDLGGFDRPVHDRARFDERRGRVVDGVRDPAKGRHRDAKLLSERAGPIPADADLVTVVAYVVATAQTEMALAAPEHGVAGDADPEPGRRHAGTNGGNGADPLVAGYERQTLLPRLNIDQRACKELRVSSAQADPRHVHANFLWTRLRILNFLDGTCKRAGDDKSAHRRSVSDRSAGRSDDNRMSPSGQGSPIAYPFE